MCPVGGNGFGGAHDRAPRGNARGEPRGQKITQAGLPGPCGGNSVCKDGPIVGFSPVPPGTYLQVPQGEEQFR